MNFCLQREEELVSAWWREYAEVSEGPVNSSSQNREQREGSIGDLKSLNQTNDQGGSYGGNSLDFDEGESVGVLVKGGLYEVCLVLKDLGYIQETIFILSRNHTCCITSVLDYDTPVPFTWENV